ncbi:class I SAM-dependent methyltransferase [Nocardioides currus]|uniref:SAM-dependent methyltransferase n=1 Tax=Nocardioides currus TaxID=2133958 RepID=A0A2R7Z0U2_9ACTN|nr:class I SAM-dependent methyltransferase [Nocardioides currus]PUA82184.1 SAM-dependent methyltransferase [Nocardioides currus]
MTHSFDQDYWDQIWHGDRAGAMGSSPPNPHLVSEVADLPAGTALEAGCGGGAEAIWLAEQGWRVTGADVASSALSIAAARASSAGVDDRVEWIEADLSTWEPPAAYDLVTTHYAHPAMPQLEFYDRLASWVAPGGTLFVVGHLGYGHGHGDTPAEASVTADAVTAQLDPALWEVVTSQETSRTVADGHGRSIHDVVVRARRRD